MEGAATEPLSGFFIEMENDSTLAHLLTRGFTEETVAISSDLKIIFANQAFLEGNDLKLSQVSGKYCYEVLKGCQESCRQSKRECPLHEIITTKAPVSTTHHDVEINNHTCHFKIDIYPIIPGHNEPISFLHITRNISNRIEEERFKDHMWTEILGRMEQIYSSMIDNSNIIERVTTEKDYLIDTMPLAMVTWDRDGQITKWNSSAEVLFGWQADAIIGEPFINIFASGRSQDLFESERQAIVQGKSLAYALSENRTTTGHVLFCEWYHSALSDKDSGIINGGLSLGQDVTERFSIQKELTAANKELTVLLKSTDEAIIALNHLNRIIVWNQAAENLFGWLNHEVMGTLMDQLFPSEFIAQHTPLIESFFDQNRPRPEECYIEATIKHRDGNAIPVRIKLSPAEMDEKPILVAVIKDITSRKRMERIFTETEKTRQLGELACGIAHDFNNIMTAIKGNSHILKQQLNNEELHPLHSIDQAVELGIKKVVAIQQLAGLDSNGSSPGNSFELSDLNQLLTEAIDFTQYRWKDQAQKDGNTITITHDFADLPHIPLETANMQDVFINLIFNAIDALPGSGKIHLHTAVQSDKVIIRVEDNGHGIAKNKIKSIFKPFTTSKKTDHSGLGLSTALNTVARHGGEIWAESNQGAGTIITISLPLFITSKEQSKERITQPPPKSLRIIIAEDNSMVASVLSTILQSHGHKVLQVINGRKGIELLRNEKVDLVITDLGMPEMGGEEFISRLRKTMPHLPILVITGWRDELMASRLKEAGVVDVMIKPFNVDDLLSIINSVASHI